MCIISSPQSRDYYQNWQWSILIQFLGFYCDQKHLIKEGVHFSLWSSGPTPSLRKSEEGTSRGELKQRPKTVEDVLSGLLSLYTIQDYLNRGDTAHCGLGSSIPHQLPIKQENALTGVSTVQSYRTFSLKIPSSQIHVRHTDEKHLAHWWTAEENSGTWRGTYKRNSQNCHLQWDINIFSW